MFNTVMVSMTTITVYLVYVAYEPCILTETGGTRTPSEQSPSAQSSFPRRTGPSSPALGSALRQEFLWIGPTDLNRFSNFIVIFFYSCIYYIFF